jgi:hypothetical protein
VTVPEDFARILEGNARIGGQEQVFPFLTVDEPGFPHVTLLSRAELDVDPSRTAVLVVVAGQGVRENLRRRGAATLIAVHGTVVHSVKLAARLLREDGPLLGGVFQIEQHKRDSVGIDITPMSFLATKQVEQLERWDQHARLLALLAQDAETG